MITLCPACVILADKFSCCGRGGSWQGKCGSDGDRNFEYTWSDGIRVCKSRSNAAIRHPGQTQTRTRDSIDDNYPLAVSQALLVAKTCDLVVYLGVFLCLSNF